MSYIVGHFTCKLDSKGRLMLPSEFKEQMGAQAEEGFVLRPGLFEGSRCLDLYTRKDCIFSHSTALFPTFCPKKFSTRIVDYLFVLS